MSFSFGDSSLLSYILLSGNKIGEFMLRSEIFLLRFRLVNWILARARDGGDPIILDGRILMASMSRSSRSSRLSQSLGLLGLTMLAPTDYFRWCPLGTRTFWSISPLRTSVYLTSTYSILSMRCLSSSVLWCCSSLILVWFTRIGLTSLLVFS